MCTCSRLGAGYLIVAAMVCGVSYSQTRSRVTQPVDNARFTRLPRTTHVATSLATDLGRAQADLPMERVLMTLDSGPERQAALDQLIAEQQDPSSQNYQRWLTPEEFAERFAPSQQDIDAVTQWLESQGFRVEQIAGGKRIVEFSGTAGEVERAFHTEIHHYDLNGASHVANAVDIAVPEALAPVIGGLASLHTFRHAPMHRMLTVLANGSQGLGPYDFATIYNVRPLWNTNFDGTGQPVAVGERTNIRLSDVAAFRSYFGLPANVPQVIVNGTDPGIVASEELEADLDVEWSGAIAKGATVKMVVSRSTNASDGVDLSNQYIVNNNLAAAMSVSFGTCEAALGSGNAFYNALWQQAAAQGISVFVAAGDSGSAGCDNPDSTLPASHGFGVNGLASTPYNTAVGGTAFNEAGNIAAYWNSTNDANKASAKSYIPEVVWNVSSYARGSRSNNLSAGSGGVSRVYATPSWQTGAGVPAGDPGAASQHHRYVPDVSLTASGHDGYLVMRGGNLSLVGGTSAATPAFAGLGAVLAQYTGGRNGNLNPRLYSLAAQTPAAFHDVTSGTNAVPCAGRSSGCSATALGTVGTMNGYAAGAGYDLATGLGSVDAYAMALNWGSLPSTTPVITSLSPNPMAGSTVAQTLTITGASFANGATVQASYPGGTVVNPVVSNVTSTQITVAFVAGLATRLWSIVVTNPNGQSSYVATLQVNAPALPPAITTLSPNPMTGSNSSQMLTINGSSFQSGRGLSVSLTYTGGPVTTLTGTQVLFINSGRIQARVNVGTAARTWSVTVTNPGGLVSNAASLTVTAPPPRPAITSLSPNPMSASSTAQTLAINGTGFVPGAGLRVVATSGFTRMVLQGSQITSATATQIVAAINVGTGRRNWTIQVVNPDGTPSNRATLQVK